MKTALITGGTRGIGLGIARSLLNEGVHLALNGVRPESEVQELISALVEESGMHVIYCQGDISKQEGRSNVLKAFAEHFSTLNYLINNAGVAPKERKDLLDIPEESLDRVLNINLKGPFLLSQAVAKMMMRSKLVDPSKDFAIVNVGSISATMASPERGQYCLSKAGVAMMTQLFAIRLSESDIPVYELRPGIIKTDMTGAVTNKYDVLFAKGVSIQNRWGLPEDVGKAVASLIRRDFSYSSGQIFHVDGGISIQRL